MKDNGAVKKRGRPLGSKNNTTIIFKKRTKGEGGLANWILIEARKLSAKTGVGVNQVIEDAFKAGFVAVRDNYANLIQYRNSLDELWENRNEPTALKTDREESARDRRGFGGDLESELQSAVSSGDEGEDPTLEGLGDADVGPGPGAQSQADHPSPDQSPSEHLVSSDGGDREKV